MTEGLDIAAIIAAVTSGGISILSIYITRKNDIELEKLKNKLEIEKDEESAIRDYRFEALKRLYRECEPILFQFAELSDSALLRILALAKNAQQGNLGPKNKDTIFHTIIIL